VLSAPAAVGLEEEADGPRRRRRGLRVADPDDLLRLYHAAAVTAGGSCRLPAVEATGLPAQQPREVHAHTAATGLPAAAALPAGYRRRHLNDGCRDLISFRI
jgi:hypothetical protein